MFWEKYMGILNSRWDCYCLEVGFISGYALSVFNQTLFYYFPAFVFSGKVLFIPPEAGKGLLENCFTEIQSDIDLL